jgi:predicted DNA-binding WGR domain protein
MRIFMQTQPGPGESPKYFQLVLQQDLLGGWTLVREAGQPGHRTTVKRDVYLDLDGAQSAMERARDQQLKRGFRVMFSQGTDAPDGLPSYGD